MEKKIEMIYSLNHERNVFKCDNLFWTSDGTILKNKGIKKMKRFDYNIEDFVEFDGYWLEENERTPFKMKYLGNYWDSTCDPCDRKMWKKVRKYKKAY